MGALVGAVVDSMSFVDYIYLKEFVPIILWTSIFILLKPTPVSR
jgi:hypothetical protein